MPFVSFMEESDNEEVKQVYAGILDEVPDLGDLVVMPSDLLNKSWGDMEKWLVISRTMFLKEGGSSWILIVGQPEC